MVLYVQLAPRLRLIMEKKFIRSISTLEQVFDFIRDFSEQNDIDADITHALDLSIEEIFTNMVKYNPGRDEDIILGLVVKNGKAIVSLTDFEDQPFDLVASKVYDLDQSLEDRPVGKLGLYLVKKLMDKIDYQHKNGKTIITLVKDLRKSHV